MKMQEPRSNLLSFIVCSLFIVILTLILQPQRIIAQTAQTVSVVSVTYQGHVQSIGWQPWVFDGAEAGTEGKALRVEALKINLVNSPVGASIKYQAHVQNIGWQPWVSAGQEAGTHGKSLRVEAIKITLENMPGYIVQYQAHVQSIGWQPWVSSGQEAGTHGKSLRVEAIRIRIVPNIINIASVSLNKTTDNLVVGGSDTLAAVLLPANAPNQAALWSSSKPSVVKVDSTGKVTALSAGTATVTVTTVDGNKTASCAVTVKSQVVHPISVSLNKTSDDITVGDTDTLTAAVNPSNVTSKDVTWSSSNSSIAVVDNAGKITILSKGTATITVTTVDGQKTATCIVTGKNIIINKITLTNYNISLSDFSNQELLNTPAAYINGKWIYALIKNGEFGYCTDLLNPSDTWVNSLTIYNNIKNQLLNNINPLYSQNDPIKIYEFVTLSYTDCVTAAQLNTMFGQSGSLAGKGQVFIDAAKANNINPIYLAGHSILETGHGTSILANGGTKNLAGNYTYGTPVYNLFGIGAIDGDAEGGGTRTAYSNGWTSIDLAIYGGAAWISKGYIGASQNTLYSMRWNPLNIYHQYATDVNWAASQTNIIKGYFDLLPGCTLTFNIPVFK